VFLTIASVADLSYLLHKHPGRPQSVGIAAGVAHVFYPSVTEDRCTAAVLLEVDPIELVRSGRGPAHQLGQYVNDRPYAASSLLAVALSKLFRTAMSRRCDARPELVEERLPFSIHIPALPCRGGSPYAERLFAPLGWTVEATAVELDPEIPDWGDSPYVDLRLTGDLRLADALNHLYVMLPVLDDAKHYWVGPDEVDKLVRAGGDWLAGHPEKELITRRYLAHQRTYVTDALERLTDIDETAPRDVARTGAAEVGDDLVTDAVPLSAQRRTAVVAALREAGAHRVADLGCGEGSLVRELLADPAFTEILATDVSARELERAARRLRVDDMPERQRSRLRLFQSSATYRDQRLAGLDAAVLMEVIEHVDRERLPALVRSVFGSARPRTVIVTTPNAEYNVRFEGLTGFRHPDHRFEWTRSEFREWASSVPGYSVRFAPVGPDDPEVGPPTQLAVFTLEDA
jgi:3' terminal RNA ribose 2'-O-methyltransferase Hen1